MYTIQYNIYIYYTFIYIPLHTHHRNFLLNPGLPPALAVTGSLRRSGTRCQRLRPREAAIFPIFCRPAEDPNWAAFPWKIHWKVHWKGPKTHGFSEEI